MNICNINEINDNHVILNFKKLRNQMDHVFEDEEESWNLVKQALSTVEDISLNEVTVHHKTIVNNCYDKPYNRLRQLFVENFHSYYMEQFPIFIDSMPKIFFFYLEQEEF